MNKLIVHFSKKQPTILLFILQFNFNKLEALFSQTPILATKPPWMINLPWEK
jgi:hypothetical protein